MTEHRITTTMRPDQTVVVSDTELQDLERMHVIASRLDEAVPDTPQEESGGDQEEPEAERGQEAPAEAQRLRTSG